MMGAVLNPRHRAPLRVLLLDQSQASHARLALLHDVGCTTTLAGSLAEVSRQLRAGDFEVVVADHPSASGDPATLIAEIRHVRPSISVILVSAFAESVGLNEANTGADIVIQKSAHEVAHLTRSVTRLQKRRPARKPVRSAAATANTQARTV